MAIRAFGVLDPTEALVSLSAFLATFLAAGWRPGAAFPGGTIALQASGAAFAAVVIGQTANAWACRSARLTPWRLGWFGNRLVVLGAGVELVVGAAFLGIPILAVALDQATPTLVGATVALAAAPAVLLADALFKRIAA